MARSNASVTNNLAGKDSEDGWSAGWAPECGVGPCGCTSQDVARVVKGMTKSKVQTVRRAIRLLCSLIDQQQDCGPLPRHNPVRRFVEEYLVADATAEITCQEVWAFFKEVVQAGELPPTRKAVFFRELPSCIEAAFHVRKCHHVQRDGHRVRGFKGVGIRMEESINPSTGTRVDKV